MRNTIAAAVLGVGLAVAGPVHMSLGSMPASAQGHGGFGRGGFGGGHGGFGGGGFHGGGFGGGGFRGEGNRGGAYGGYHGGGYGGYRGGYYGGSRGGYYGGYRGGYYGGFGFGYGCCGYYGGYYDGAGLLLGAAAVAGVTALAVDSAYDRSYYTPPPVGYYEAPVVPAGYYDRPVPLDRRALVDRCARAAEDDARSWSSAAHFVHVDTFDRDADVARIEGTLDVTVAQEHGRYDRDGFPIRDDQSLRSQPVHFTCQTDRGNVVALHLGRPDER